MKSREHQLDLFHVSKGEVMDAVTDETRNELAKSEATPLVVKLPGNPETDPQAARQVHTIAIAGAVYGGALQHQFARMFGAMDLDQSALTYANDLMERMAPRDPMEEMLVLQAMLAHVRVLHLTNLANRQERIDSVRAIHEYADRASNTFRRLMLALREYRKPPRAGYSFTAIKQANIAGQQLVQNNETSPAGITSNEEEGTHDADAGQRISEVQPTSPAECRGAGIASSVDSAGETVAVFDRAEDT